ncbi:MAG: hypothetical protein U5J96_12155 [Ignavibacteriaceae bacterium]|nr:hypothetical protein [Ignavibacteriaceae bacterium]
MIKAQILVADDEGQIVDGFKLSFVSDSKIELDTIRSRWSDPDVTKFTLREICLTTANRTKRAKKTE